MNPITSHFGQAWNPIAAHFNWPPKLVYVLGLQVIVHQLMKHCTYQHITPIPSLLTLLHYPPYQPPGP